jgi:hypothetical protein
MKTKEIITEANFDPGVKKALVKAGYKFLGAGQDQDVYVAPDGSILKIFGTGPGAAPGKGNYSKAQWSFIDFANYCMKNANNPFLPTIGGVEQFVFNGNTYLQISMERMFDFSKQKAYWLADQLEYLASESKFGSADYQLKNIKQELEPQPGLTGYDAEYSEDMAKMVLYLGGEENLLLLLQTVKDLSKIADNKGYHLDLHSGNFMLGSDGNIVISDPFFTGSYRGSAHARKPIGGSSRDGDSDASDERWSDRWNSGP